MDSKKPKAQLDLFPDSADKITELKKLAKLHYRHKKYDKALGLFREAAELGDPVAMYFTGEMYDAGKGVNQDYERAVFWYTQAAEQGDPSAQCRLGKMYRDGEGVSKDSEQALYWYTKAAEQGCHGAPPFLRSKYQKSTQ